MRRSIWISVFVVQMFFYAAVPLYATIPWLHADGNQLKDPEGNVVILRGVALIDLGFLEDWQGGAFEMIDRLTDPTDIQGTSPGWYPKILRINITPPDSVSNWPHPFDPGNDDFYNNLLRPLWTTVLPRTCMSLLTGIILRIHTIMLRRPVSSGRIWRRDLPRTVM